MAGYVTTEHSAGYVCAVSNSAKLIFKVLVCALCVVLGMCPCVGVCVYLKLHPCAFVYLWISA